jgi:hypothetical protein
MGVGATEVVGGDHPQPRSLAHRLSFPLSSDNALSVRGLRGQTTLGLVEPLCTEGVIGMCTGGSSRIHCQDTAIFRSSRKTYAANCLAALLGRPHSPGLPPLRF